MNIKLTFLLCLMHMTQSKQCGIFQIFEQQKIKQNEELKGDLDLYKPSNGNEFTLYGWIRLIQNKPKPERLFQLNQNGQTLVKVEYGSDGDRGIVRIDYLFDANGTMHKNEGSLTLQQNQYYHFVYSSSFKKKKHYLDVYGPKVELNLEMLTDYGTF